MLDATVGMGRPPTIEAGPARQPRAAVRGVAALLAAVPVAVAQVMAGPLVAVQVMAGPPVAARIMVMTGRGRAVLNAGS